MKKIISLALLTGAVLSLAACSDDSGKKAEASASAAPAAAEKTAQDKLETRFVTIATGGASGPYNIIGTSLAEIYAGKYGANAKTQTTGASVENLNLLNQGKVEMAFVMSDALNDAVTGEGSFSQKIASVDQIAVLYPNYVQIVTSKSSGIKTLADLKGRRVAVGDQNSGVEVASRTLLDAAGITYDDIKVDYLGYAAAADALKGGRIDAAFLTSGLPNASIMELQQGFDLQMVSVPPETVSKAADGKPFFEPLNIPKGTYGNDEDIPTAAIRNALVVRADLSEDDVYKLTKTFFDSIDTLKNAHQAVKGINAKQDGKNFIAPIHPGAKKYFDEIAAQ